ncbi:IgA-specific serine endopeptidase [Streptomyces sp. KO7888]|uniref:hypothetical protein n=1 Tax=Streptomyces sp. KO7888 TaxID=2602737 RepID=UPI0013F623D5|nr:hypothetical protein [Streptomyces sp. KO7888]NHI08866.1 IgA-specific serine endopeptidase [Streptomyces sp. KO7888]
MAALQAKAGNRAVTTAIQRATVTSPGPETTDEVRASSSRTPEAAASGSGQAQGEQQQDDAARRKQAAEDEAKDLKKQAGTAALTRADAEAQMWRKTGVAAAARKEATAAEGEAVKSRDKTDAAERQRAEAEGRERDWAVQVEEAEKARSAAATTVSDRTGDETAAGKRQAEARDGLADAEAEVQRCTEEAETAAKELAAVEAEVERRRKKAEATAKELADAEAEVERCTKESDDAAEAHRRAEASLEALASAEDEAQKQAKQAAEAAHAAVETWATAVTAAKEQVVALQRKAEKRQGKVEAEEDRQREAEAAVRERAGAVTSAEKEVDDAQDVLRKRSDEFAAATRAREDAETTLTTREETKAAAEQQVSRAAADRERQENAKAAAQQEVARFEATASAHRRVEKDAREAAGAAARVRQQAGQDEAVAREGATEATKRAGEAAGQTEQTEQTEQTAEPEKPGRLKRFSKAFGFTNLKKMGDPGDTVILRGTAPSGAAARAAASDAHRAPAFGTPSQQVFESSHNFGITALGLGNDSRGLVSALKTPKDTQGSAAHQADKDKKGKSAGVLTNATMLAGDGMKVGGGAATKSGIVEGVTAAGEGVGVTTGLFSVGIGAREGRAIHLTSQKRDALKKHALKDVEAVRTRTLQVVLDRLGAVNAELVDKAAAESGSEAGPTAEQIDSLDRSRAEVASLRTELREHLASAQQYAIHKQDNKIIKRAVSLGGNVVRTAGGILVVITLAGTLATPAAPAVGATGAAVLGGLAAYKGGKGGYKRAESVRHPDKWRRTTMAQGDTEFTEAGEEQKGSGWRAALEAVKVTKSIEQGERQLRAQEIYALAAGPAVPVGRNVPEDIRAEARGLLLDLKCDPARRNENAKEWSDSLNDPEQQEDWEKYIAKQLAS